MDGKLDKLEIRSLGDCTIREITEQWNTGFQQYVDDSNMSRTIVQMSSRIGRMNIHPELSVAAYIEGVPAGFVMIGLAQANGRKLAWNGGTGVNPSFRGLSISKLLLGEAIRRTEAGAHSLSLETRVENERAIRAYEKVGFRIEDTMHIMRKEGGFTTIPFVRSHGGHYDAIPSTPKRVGQLSFYASSKNAWKLEWFVNESCEAIIAADHRGEPAGYALFKRSLNSDGELVGVELIQCEADPRRSDSSDVVRFMLGDLFSPLAPCKVRSAYYLREKNTAALEAVREAGFQTVMAEHLMVLDFM